MALVCCTCVPVEKFNGPQARAGSDSETLGATPVAGDYSGDRTNGVRSWGFCWIGFTYGGRTTDAR